MSTIDSGNTISADSLQLPSTEATYTPDDLLVLRDAKCFELVDGRLLERKMGAESSWIAQELNRLVGNHAAEHKLGLVWGADASYRCFGEDGNNVRRSDGSFIAYGRLANDERGDLAKRFGVRR